MSARPLARYGQAYLASAWWHELREAYERHPLTPHCCAVCAAPRYELHHRTYERLGAEHISDLIGLCRTHHEGLHRAWRTHRRYHPEDTLDAFTDAWVLIARRRFATAPLPALGLYEHDRRRRDRRAAVAGGADGGPGAAVRAPLTR